ncbi:MAG: hypothetical protein VYD54_10575 [Bdellovibrionota bacterium]|nr:hypothetical protein [Bdellovibrionota bacterium]
MKIIYLLLFSMLCSPFSFSDVKIRLIANSTDNIFKSDNTKKIMKRYLNEKRFEHLVVQIDETGILCDGSLVKFRKLKKNPSKLADLIGEPERNYKSYPRYRGKIKIG